MLRTALVLTGSLAFAASASAATVGQFGDHGWRSDDTRDASGLDLVGSSYTHAGKSGVTPTPGHDALIAQQIQFVDAPAGSTYGGAVAISGTAGNSGKSTVSVISADTGFDAAENLLTDFSATYQWYKQPNPTSRTLAFRLGIQSTQWGSGLGQSQNGFTATRSGESSWDLILVHVPTPSQDNAWNTVSVDAETDTWFLYAQAGNTFYSAPGATSAKTLEQWAADETFGSVLFGSGAMVTNIQFGLGSSQRAGLAYVDYLQTNLLNNGEVVNFVPEPASLALLALAGGMALFRRGRAA